MVYDLVRFGEQERVSLITLLGPPRDFSGLAQLSAELSDCCRRFREKPDQRILVLTGQGPKAFAMTECLESSGVENSPLPSLAEPLAAVERPVLAAIGGDALGPGLELALACDLTFAAQGAHFALPQIKYGAIPWDGGTQRLLRAVGPGKALEMVLTGEALEAREALRIGLVSRLAAEDEVLPAALETAHRMAAMSPIALEYSKEAVKKGADLSLGQGLRLEADLYFLIHTTKDRSEGLTAFRQKRKPRFSGD